MKGWETKEEVKLTARTVSLVGPLVACLLAQKHEETTTVPHCFCTTAFPCLQFLV